MIVLTLSSIVSGSKDLFCYSAAVTAEVEEEEEFACTSPGRPSPNSLPDSPYVFTVLLSGKAENGAADRAREGPFKWRVMSCSHHGPNL